MKIFICSRSINSKETSAFAKGLLKASSDSIAILREEEHSENWKGLVEKKLKEVDFVVFILGAETFESDPMKWEYAKAKRLNKRIVGLKLESASEESVLFCQGFPTFSKPDQCWKYLEKTYEEDRQLLLEQYKIMVGSTEKVTDQRLRVNNLFFTVTSSILSVSLVVGKALEFSIIGAIGMLALSGMAFLTTFLWEKLIRSYGNLNKGKFIIIDEIEKQLRTNMFENEWKILKDDVKYEPNTETEATIVLWFRLFVIFVAIVEFIYVLSKVNWHELF